MNVNSLKGIISIILIVAGVSTSAQDARISKGYLIKNGETIQGEFIVSNTRKLFKEASFRASSSSSFEIYQPTDISEYYVEGLGYFLSKPEFDKKFESSLKAKYFFQILDRGKAILYVVNDDSKKDHFFIEKDNNVTELEFSQKIARNELGQQVKQSDKKYLATLREYFSDSQSELNYKINFNSSQLKKLVSSYNKSVDPTYITINKQSVVKHIGIVFSESFSSTKLGTKNIIVPAAPLGGSNGFNYVNLFDLNNRSYSYNNLGFGISSEIFLGRNKHFSFLAQLIYAPRSFVSEEMSYSVKSIELPLGLKYRVALGSPIRPYVGLGIVVPLITTKKFVFSPLPVFDFTGDPIFDQQGNQVYLPKDASDDIQTGALRTRASLFIGLEAKITKKTSLSFQGRFENLNYSENFFTLKTGLKILELRYSFLL
jgi:hypothetical protein